MERLPNRYPKISQSHKVPLYKGLSLFYPKLLKYFVWQMTSASFFDAMTAKYTLKPTGKRKYHRDSTMSKAEVMLIMILFHDSGYHCFKHFYLEKRCRVSMYKGLLTHSLLCSKFVELTLF